MLSVPGKGSLRVHMPSPWQSAPGGNIPHPGGATAEYGKGRQAYKSRQPRPNPAENPGLPSMGPSSLPPVGRQLGIASLEEDVPDSSRERVEEVESEVLRDRVTQPPGVMNPENSVGDA